ncbi:MAG: hypothetical protein KAG19_04790 [Methylococcales bacterium]|nr:hypothetical protein [Methylococcales bacterium]
MLTIFKKKSLATMIAGLVACSSASALTVTSGQFIQKNKAQALKRTSSLVVNSFFNDRSLVGVQKIDVLKNAVSAHSKMAMPKAFSYRIHSPQFLPGHPDRSSGVNSFSSHFQFTDADVVSSANDGRIGLGGVMRYILPPLANGKPRYFLLGDFTLEYDSARKERFNFSGDATREVKPINYGVSGWHLVNHFELPSVAYDVLNATVIKASDSFYLSGELSWSPEMSLSFFSEKAMYQVVSEFSMCAQDDRALASNSVKQIPCVFPQITVDDKTDEVSVSSGAAYTLAVDLGVATGRAIKRADYFVVFIHKGKRYWLDQAMQWVEEVVPAYQGALVDFRKIKLPHPILPSGKISSGSEITVLFGVDSVQNGVFDEPSRLSSVVINFD